MKAGLNFKRNSYEEFRGDNKSTLPKLLGEGYIPISIAEIMKLRLERGINLLDWRQDITSSDLVAHSKYSSKIKIILTVDKDENITYTGRNALGLFNQDAESAYKPSNPKYLYHNAINLKDQYDSLSGEGVIKVLKSNLGRVGEFMKKDEILNCQFCKILARHPDEVPKSFAYSKKLLENYVDWVSYQTKEDRNMKALLYKDVNFSILTPLWTSTIRTRSCISDMDVIDKSGNFIGIKPKE